MSAHTKVLKPCPFCGGPAHTTPEVITANLAALVMCTGSDCAHVSAPTLKAAIEKWNARPVKDDLLKALEAIERGAAAVLLDAALSDAPDGFDECPINPSVLQRIVEDARAALSRARSNEGEMR